jgi:thioredoxin 1
MKLWTKLLIVVALIGAVVFLVEHKKRQDFSCAGGVCTLQDVKQPAQPVAAETPVQKSLPRLLDLGSGKCVPCKMMKPVLDELAAGYADRFETVFIDVWENQQAGEQYGIRMIPTQIFFDAEGKELFRHEGFFSKEDILAKWQEFLVVADPSGDPK